MAVMAGAGCGANGICSRRSTPVNAMMSPKVVYRVAAQNSTYQPSPCSYSRIIKPSLNVNKENE